MSEPPPNASILIDVGSTNIKAGLLRQAQGAPRLAASVAVSNTRPGDSEKKAVGRALDELQRVTGWPVSLAMDNATGIAFRHIVVSSSTSTRLPLAILTGSESGLVDLIARVQAIGEVEMVVALSLEGHDGLKQRPLEHLGTQLDGLELAAVVVSAKSHREANVIAALISAANLRFVLGRLRILFAGAADVADALSSVLPSGCDFCYLSSLEWSDGHFPASELETALSKVLPSPENVEGAGLADGKLDTEVEVFPQSTGQLANFLSRVTQGSVCFVEVGGKESSIHVAYGPGNQSAKAGSLQPLQSSIGFGTAQGLGALLDRVDIKDVMNWLPFDIDEDVLWDYLGNRCLKPGFLPEDVKQLMIEQAVARVCGLAARRGELRTDILVATGGLAAYPRIAQSMICLLDIAQPISPCRLLLDRTDLLPRLSALAQVDSRAALSLLHDDTFVNLGACLSLAGHAKQGDSVAEIGIQRHFGDDADPVGDEELFEIRFGTITVIPLGSNEQAGIRVATSRRFSFAIELAGPVWSDGSARPSSSPSHGVAGGMMGLVVDARGRPMELASDAAQRQARLSDWLRSIDAYDAEVFSRLD